MARLKLYQREQAYRFYIAENLRIIGENTAHISGGSCISKKLSEILTPQNNDNRTANEIITDVINKAGLEERNEFI